MTTSIEIIATFERESKNKGFTTSLNLLVTNVVKKRLTLKVKAMNTNSTCVNPSYKLKALVIGVILCLGVAAKNGYLNSDLFQSANAAKANKSVSFSASAE